MNDRQLFDAVQRRMCALAGRGASDLDDLVQVAAEQVFRNLHRFEGRSEVSTWLYSICYRVLLRQRRWYRRWRLRFSLDDLELELAHEGPGPGAALEAREQERLIHTGLAQLSDKYRAVLVLHDLEDMPVREIARVIQVGEATVRSRLRDGRKQLAKVLQRNTAGHVAVWMIAGMLLGMGSLYAATLVHERWQALPRAPHAAAPPDRGRPAPRVSAVQPTASSPPSVVEEARSLDSAPRAAPSSMLEAQPLESWQRAARGLRENDFDAADEALRKLSRQGSAAERDAAQLVRAQLLFRQERRAEARQLLTQLATGAVAPATRQRARELLEQLAPATPSHRSFAPIPGTNSP